jgi:hypothetical protein
LRIAGQPGRDLITPAVKNRGMDTMAIFRVKLKSRQEIAFGTMAFHFEKPEGFAFKPIFRTSQLHYLRFSRVCLA